MAEQAKKSNKTNIIIAIMAAVVVIAGIIVGAVLISNNHNNQTIDSSFFASDDKKYVLSVTKDDSNFSSMADDTYGASAYHMVTYYKDDVITGMEVYYAFDDEEIAKSALKSIKNDIGDNEETKSIDLRGKYIVIVASQTGLDNLGMSASDFKNMIDLIETFKNTDIEETETVAE